jgi:F-type H+/Na+-transporting ATPase subunit alpha
MNDQINSALKESVDLLHQALEKQKAEPRTREIGRVVFVGEGIARIRGLEHAQSEELLRFEGDRYGMAFNLDPDEIGVVLFDVSDEIGVGQEVYRTRRVVDVPVGEALLGRMVDPVGRPMDGQGRIRSSERRPIERPAPEIMDRSPVQEPLQTGLKVLDALIPIGRGQRELIVGDRQTGKTAIAVDTIINQRDKDVTCIYCAIGQKSSDVAKTVDQLQKYGAMDHTIVVFTDGQDPPGLQFIAPYAATAIGEFFMDRGEDVLLVYDDLTHHARAYRELSLLLRRPPAREAYPGDIFYIHSRLLERATHFSEEKGGGSLSALPIVETQAQNMSAYIPTNLISITDGQIALSPNLFQKGLLPPVDVGKSVSRVGGKTQLAAYRDIAGDLRLSYSQFEEVESFSRFSTRLDEETRQTLERGYRVRQVLKQAQYQPIPVLEQIAVLFAVTEGYMDEFEVDQVSLVEDEIRKAVRDQHQDLKEPILENNRLSEEQRETLKKTFDRIVKDLKQQQSTESGQEIENSNGAQDANT